LEEAVETEHGHEAEPEPEEDEDLLVEHAEDGKRNGLWIDVEKDGDAKY
jgi:hypothetical protein